MIHGAASECAPISNASNIAITRGGRRQKTMLSWRKSGARLHVSLESQETRGGTALMGGSTQPWPIQSLAWETGNQARKFFAHSRQLLSTRAWALSQQS